MTALVVKERPIPYRTGTLNMYDAFWSESQKCGHWDWPPKT